MGIKEPPNPHPHPPPPAPAPAPAPKCNRTKENYGPECIILQTVAFFSASTASGQPTARLDQIYLSDVINFYAYLVTVLQELFIRLFNIINS